MSLGYLGYGSKLRTRRDSTDGAQSFQSHVRLRRKGGGMNKRRA